MVARHLGVPSEISERQPFPGPGLSVRVVEEINVDKLDSEKKATDIVEENFSRHKPSQYFAAVLDNKTVSHTRTMHIQENTARLLNVPLRNAAVKVFKAKATGIKSGKRLYGEIAAIKLQKGASTILPYQVLFPYKQKSPRKTHPSHGYSIL
jgi:GMP synthase (glutamine-hydrolysing)